MIAGRAVGLGDREQYSGSHVQYSKLWSGLQTYQELAQKPLEGFEQSSDTRLFVF